MNNTLQFNNICLAYNAHKNTCLEWVSYCAEYLEKRGINFTTLPLSHIDKATLSPNALKDIQLVIVFGGDGTLLSATRYFAQYQAAILGLNLGHLGFLTEANNPDLSRLDVFLDEILAGQYKLETRSMVEAYHLKAENNDHMKDTMTIIEGRQPDMLALNEIVVTRGSRSSMINLALDIDDDLVAKYSADGLIVCTPTGSTAYALGAGGSILAPDLQTLQIIPICAHSLTSRPLVVSDNSVLRITVHARYTNQNLINLQADGQENLYLSTGDQILIKKSSFQTNLIRSLNPANNFYKVLHRKLLWGN